MPTRIKSRRNENASFIFYKTFYQAVEGRRINLQQTITEKLKAMMRDPFLIIPGIFCLIESDIMYQLYM